MGQLESIDYQSKHMLPAWSNVREDFSRLTARQFATNGRGRWAPLASSTIAERVAKGYGLGPTLVREDDLIDSLTIPGASYNITRITSVALEAGTVIPYARFHQYGTRRMPARKVIDLTPIDRRRWAWLVQEHLMGRRLRRVPF